MAAAPQEPPLLICGNRNYSSWSLRAWLVLRKAAVDPEVVVLPMDTPEFEARIGDYSPTRRVPVLRMGSECIWDSLAIAETVSERFGDVPLWPEDPQLRALGRAMAAEMHSGFSALREALPMNCRARQRSVEVSPPVSKDIQRIEALWAQARQQSDSSGWLLGDFSIADAMFAPVVLRFRAYALDLSDTTRSYCDHWLKDEDLQHWIGLGEQEPWVIDHEEVGEPTLE
ncbi:glutathione S-transferase family protein [Congregibacter litoralis]|uniref:Glutathione S-transferase n=1 Tax=Congregibacter litoralis KT71 TaxID=314285 RepID=A4AA69_9GAMM|nr:glutathione S-transferase family protein [Congregibacter litoralis]EAQ96946.2 Glutathione S-transferase [Congregibacter litoralis KT71]